MPVRSKPPHERAAWLRYAGRRATVLAPPGSFAARRAGEALREAERTVNALDHLLGAPSEGATRVDILLVDTVPGALSDGARPDLTGLELTPGAPPPLVRVVSPEGSAEPLALPLTRMLVGQRFGPRALAADTVLRGLAGMVAAEAQSGPSRADADTWIQSRLANRDRPLVVTAMEPDEAPRLRLAVRDGVAERLIDVPEGELVIGRHPDGGLVLDGPGVSRRHAVLTRAADRFAIHDNAS